MEEESAVGNDVVNYGNAIASNPTGDDRFAAVFQSADFEMDPSSGTCLLQAAVLLE